MNLPIEMFKDYDLYWLLTKVRLLDEGGIQC